ncbi:hypothetical protein PsorP6_006502 [Peronosclerospora sorghi]|uniref:Uncharacterized protein n=1 Tax=Peronosclerospora sorghi TaxID=230839 RepID=A0ACC0W5W6_9STRA|nr:hypothetical protein PsorP6_006502 [Peronosclerospora sorghi]
MKDLTKHNAENQRKLKASCAAMGFEVTGIIIMILLKLPNRTKLAIFSDFCRFTRDHGIEKDESEYLAAVSEDIVVTAEVLGLSRHFLQDCQSRVGVFAQARLQVCR